MLAHAKALFFIFGALASFQLLAANPQVEFETSRGNFVVELYPDKAPRTVENFLLYVNNGFYSGTIFHRTIHKFLVQGGGLTEKLAPKPTRDPIPNESTNGLSNEFGTLAMARAYGSDTATSQFFVNLEDNRFLNYYRHEPGLEGYTVFGRVIRGLEVLLSISDSQTANVGKLDHVPKDPAVIHASRLLETPVLAENTPLLRAQEPIEKKNQSTKKGKKRG
jgi:cyclophilin family peptidyl-prolyl cis-trans isomerase